MSRAMESPKPEPPVSWLRELSSLKNGLNTSLRYGSGMPGPSSSIRISMFSRLLPTMIETFFP